MNKFFKVTKPILVVVFSVLVFCFSLVVKIIIAVLLSNDESENNAINSFYVIDEKGNEMIDDNVTYVFDLDNQRDYKGPL